MSPPPEVSFFFDLPVSDVSRNVCDALRILYHGSLEGAFGTPRNDRVDLNEVKAIKIPIAVSSAPASSPYEYNLVCYSKELSGSLWKFEDREKQAELRALTQRVSLNRKKSPFAKRILTNLFVKPDLAVCPVYFTQFEGLIPHDGCVPLEYHRKLVDSFDGYLMRCKRDFPLVRSLFRAQHIDLAKRRFSRHEGCARPVVTYMLKKAPTTLDAPLQQRSESAPSTRKTA